MIIAIDPGRTTGWAVFYPTGKLNACGIGDPREVFSGIRIDFEEVIIEKPQVYRASKMKGDPNDLITLAIRVGEYKQFFQSRQAKVSLVLPAEWKGQLPKKIHHARLAKLLGPVEANTVAASESVFGKGQLDMWDAIGLGMFFTKRVGLGGVTR